MGRYKLNELIWPKRFCLKKNMAVPVKNEKGKRVGGNIKLLQENKTTYTDIYPQADDKAKLRGHIFLSDTLPHGLCNFYKNYKSPQIVAK